MLDDFIAEVADGGFKMDIPTLRDNEQVKIDAARAIGSRESVARAEKEYRDYAAKFASKEEQRLAAKLRGPFERLSAVL